jgi:FKBP-type peptidyl-prolyl cis-trans isomerase SlyD
VSTPEQIVADDQVVTLAYVMRLDDGQEIGRSPESEPLEYLQGQGEILPGLETALYGMEIGEEKHIEVQAADAYGEYDREDFADLPRASFPDDLELVVGEALMVRDDENGDEFQAIIAEVSPETIKLDFNHPLAGSALHFDVKIINLRPASAEELSHGHVHSAGHEH